MLRYLRSCRFQLALFVLIGVGSWTARIEAQPLGIFRELFPRLDPTTTSLAALTNHPNFLNNAPDQTNVLTTTFETERNRGDEYGQRLRAFLVPPATGDYTFWLASDEQAQLYLSTSENPADKQLLAFVDPRSQSRVWTTHAGQQSARIALQAGRRYYLEVLHREGLLLDHLAVRWQMPDGTIEEPIPASRFIYEVEPVFTSPVTNAIVEEGRTAVIAATLANFLPQDFRWQRDGADISGATNRSLTLSHPTLADDGARFRLFVANSVAGTNSGDAILTVRRDTNAPVLRSVASVSPTNLLLRFSEPVATNSALSTANYTLAGATIFGASFADDGAGVLLTTAPFKWGADYTLSFSNIFDRASAPNRIVPGTFEFTALAFNPSTISVPAQPGSLTAVEGGADVASAALGTGDSHDEFQFGWRLIFGDFDLRVRVESLAARDVWAVAGLMARESLATDSRFAAVFATPSLAGSFFQSRTNTGWSAPKSGWSPVAFPNVWLRLKRAGDTFTGYAGADGQHWTLLGSTAIARPGQIHLGFAVASHDSHQFATAKFRDFSPVTSAAPGTPLSEREPLGPSSRRTGLVISEIMYHPRIVPPATNDAPLEFIELFNANPFYEDISGHRFSGDIDFTFPSGTILPGGAFVVVAKSPLNIQSAYGLTNVLGPFDRELPNDSGRVQLRNSSGHVLLDVNYSSKFPWPVAADGTGHSLRLTRPSYGEGKREAWTSSDQIGGSPGRDDTFALEPLRAVVINEFLAHTDDPTPDFIELYNHSNEEIDLSGTFLTDSPATNKFRVPPNTQIPPRGFVSFDQVQLGFALSATGERIYLVHSNATRVIDAVSFEGQANGVAMGRAPDGSATLHELATATPGLPNAAPLIRNIVINEIMYHPITESGDDEYVELHNRGANAMNVTGWRFTDGIDFTFATNTSIPAGGYLVVAKNASNLLAHYSTLNTTNMVGNFAGNLSNDGERITLAMPEEVIGTNDLGQLITNLTYVVVDEVDYKTGGLWGKWSDGGGSSLELVDARSDNRLGANWADSDETSKAPWTNVESTGVLDNAAGSGAPPDTLHVLLLEAGECLLDDVEVFRSGGGNRIANPTFESGLAGWIARGNHIRSTLESDEGHSSALSLHIRATSQGDIGANRIRAPLTTAFVIGQTATIRAKVRWLAGWPEILLRLRGNSLEAYARLAVPTNLGTPGERNSRARANTGPAIHDVTHSPAVPAARQPVIVTARLTDPDGVSAVALKYRVDPLTNFNAIAMKDDGSGGDDIANDEIFSTTIPGQPADTVVAFVIEAIDNAPTAAATVFPATPADGSLTRECVIHFGGDVPASAFGTYRFWITRPTINAWINQEVLSNERFYGTFVYGNQRVIYNVGGRFSGSAAHQDQAGPDISPVGSPYHFAFDLPKDDRLLGTDNFNKIHAAGNNICDDDTLQREVTAYWIARQLGMPANYKRFVQFFVNGQRRCGLYEDTLVPGANVLESVYEDDSDGDLFKLSIWYEFEQAEKQVLGSSSTGGATLNNYTTTGGAKKTARYRWTWQPRALNSTANNFTNVFALVDAANTPAGGPLIENLEALADMEQWMRTFALEHAVGNWDSFGFRNPQNMYAYKPTRDRWQLLVWDINIVFGGGTRGTPVGPVGDDLLEYNSSDAPLGRLYATPKFLRCYWQTLQEIAQAWVDAAVVGAPLDARFAAFQASGVAVNPPDALKTWIVRRRDYLLQESAKVDAPAFVITNPTDFTSATSLVSISGVAPLRVKAILVNGIASPITWISVTNWTVQFTVAARTNVLVVQGRDRFDVTLPGATGTVTVTYTGPLTSPLRVFINEWMAANDGALADPADGDFDDWFELFNTGTNTADLSGYFLTDTLTNKTMWMIPSGTTIPAGGFRLIWADEEEWQNGANADLHAGFKLSQGGEAIALFRPDGTLLDSVTFGVQTNDVTQGRWPDGATNLFFMPTPTPRAPNAIPNPPAPQFVRFELISGNQLELTWQTVAGRTYRLEYKDDLNQVAWLSLGVPAVAQSDQFVTSDSIAASPRRFYRLVLTN